MIRMVTRLSKGEYGLFIIVVINLVVVSMLYSEMETERIVQKALRTQSYNQGNYQLDFFRRNSSFPLIQNIRIEPKDFRRRKSPMSCPDWPPLLKGKIKVPSNETKPPSLRKIARKNPNVKRGSYAPGHCLANYRVAIIIPFREREEHLKTLLNHLHPVLQRQQLDYTIYTITFAGEGVFNKAKLMNAGFVEVNKDREYDCFVFHDVDVLVENDYCLYWCSEQPRLVANYVDKFNYQPLNYSYPCITETAPDLTKVFGGATMFTQKLFLEINGLSNLYWGWGGEDDDIYWRLYSKGYDIVNPYGENCRFSMIHHERDNTNTVNPGRLSLVYHSIGRMKYDGLSNIRYRKLSFQRHPLYVNITLEVGEQGDKMVQFQKSDFDKIKCEDVKMPWEEIPVAQTTVS